MLDKKNVLIIGGTSGIGYHCSKMLSHKYNVIITGRRKIEPPDGCSLVNMNLLDEESVREAFYALRLKYKSLYGVVFSAGISSNKKNITEFDTAEWQKIYGTNVTGAIISLKYAYPMLTNGSKVVIINSFAGRTFSKYSGFEYTTSKAALTGLARHLAMEWLENGISVNSVYPSMTKTPMLESHLNSNELQKLEKDIPINRIATIDEVSNTIEFLLNEKNSYMTGCGIDINGGLYLN